MMSDWPELSQPLTNYGFEFDVVFLKDVEFMPGFFTRLEDFTQRLLKLCRLHDVQQRE